MEEDGIDDLLLSHGDLQLRPRRRLRQWQWLWWRDLANSKADLCPNSNNMPTYANCVNIPDFGDTEPQESIYGTAFADEFERGVQLGMSKSELMDADCQLDLDKESIWTLETPC